MTIQPVTLEGAHIRLEPMSSDHLDGLCDVGLDQDLWRFTATLIRSRDDMRRYIETALNEQEQKKSLPFVTVLKAGNKVIGSTRFGSIDVPNRRVEIGWMWIGRDWQRTTVNTEAKHLMLRYAFETWQVNRVELKTDRLNERSRNAMLRIGAKEEGILRSHMVVPSGRLRDTVYYSIIAGEWPDVKKKLETMLGRK
ncbi:MAG: GNAT family N-acetyltransferase [Ignavibacteriales bacterium]|nr:GNAT family N-acetyltransferase [Ignavibacteriales bacterium]